MRVELRVSSALLDRVRADLQRSHAFAAERVGFLACRYASHADQLIVLVYDYRPVADLHYVESKRYGAEIDENAFREAMQWSLSSHCGLLHVHLHEKWGIPRPSALDVPEWRRFVPDFFNITPDLPHGALVLSYDRLYGWLWTSRLGEPVEIGHYRVVGEPLLKFGARHE